MSLIIDLILMRDAASFVFCLSLAVLGAVSILVLNPPADHKPRLIAPPVIATPGSGAVPALKQKPQLLREGPAANAIQNRQPLKS